MSRARQLLNDALVWDNHGCLPIRPQDESFIPQLARYRAAGVDHVSLNVGFGDMGVDEHIRMLASLRRWIKTHPEDFLLVQSISDIGSARESGRLGISFDIEGANAIDDQLSLVSLYYDLGVRWMLLAYNLNNRAGGGCQDDDCGLTAFGRQLIDEMRRVGMVLCLSHCGPRTARDALEYATGPVVFSHSNPASLHAHPRNISDGLMRACAASGGVVGINGVGPFLGDNDTRSETVVRHIDYAVQLIGPSHVAFGLDYVFDQSEIDDWIESRRDTFPSGLGYERGMNFVRPEQFEEIVEGLMRIGYRDADLRAILGLNLFRIATICWKD